jgi:hypothetical protein
MAVPRGYGEQISYGVHARGTSMTHPSLQIVNGSPFALRFDGSGPLPSGQHLQRGVGKGCGLRRQRKPRPGPGLVLGYSRSEMEL